MGFKENLKNKRIELNLTLDDVYKQLSISKPTLQRYKSGVISNIPFDKVEKLAYILDVTPSWLMGWESNYLNEIEEKFIDKYSSLDDCGKHIVGAILDIEFNR